MNRFAIGVLSAVLVFNASAATTPEEPKPAATEPAKDPAVEAEYEALLEADQAALDEVNGWIKDNEAFRREGGGVEPAVMAAKIAARLNKMRERYEEFLKKHPKHVDVRIAFGSFLNEISRENEAAEQWDQARLLDPNQPAAWNNLANHFGHFGPVEKAFPYYEKAIELSPDEPVYYQNLATTVYLFRRDAEKYYHCDEQHVFDKALELYRKALDLSHGDFAVANDLAQTYYGITPFRYQEAVSTWKEVLKLTTNQEEQQNVFIHLARIEIKGRRLDEARNYLKQVTLPQFEALRDRLYKLIASRELKPDTEPAADSQSTEERAQKPVLQDLKNDKLDQSNQGEHQE